MCQPLTNAFPSIEERLKSASRISLFLDFDGTLSWLAPDPDEARLEERTRETLLRIIQHNRIAATVISGRAIEDLYTRIRLDGLTYAGNHGLEIFGPQFCFVEPSAVTHRESLGRLAEDLAQELASIRGILVEFKGYTASVHYRRVSEADVPRVEQVVRSAVEPARAWCRIKPGNKVFDLVPRTAWHKGMAVQLINRSLAADGGILSLYFGDDCTDEDAFRLLPDAITVKVGDAVSTSARYQLPDPDAVSGFLEWLAGTM
jgi:trehalose 6-phosphate phosphatase